MIEEELLTRLGAPTCDGCNELAVRVETWATDHGFIVDLKFCSSCISDKNNRAKILGDLYGGGTFKQILEFHR